jgi:flagellar assembly protein FliH
LQQAASATGKGAPWRVEQFEYPAGPAAPSLSSWEGWTTEPSSAVEDFIHHHDDSAHEAGTHAEFEKQLAEETRKSFEAGRERGRQEGRQTQHETQTAAVAAAQEHRVVEAAKLAERFAEERERYFNSVEREVVDLALMVAARILRREAQMDPLLLSGAVRVALGQLSSSTRVRLIVPPAELALWTETILRVPKLAVRPEVVSGDGMQLGDCMIETEMGSVDLGVRAQLGEIERGFFDRVGGAVAEPETSASSQAPSQRVTDQDVSTPHVSPQMDRP